jgi:transposase
VVGGIENEGEPMPRTRKSHPPSLKAKVALEAVKGQKTTTQIAQMFGVHPTQVGGWKKQALAGLPDIFGNGREQMRQQADAEKDELYKQIGQLKVASVITSKPAINDHLKTGQWSWIQDMKLFYRAGGSSSKLFLELLSNAPCSRPDQREGVSCFGFSFKGRFCFGSDRVAGAKPPRGAGRYRSLQSPAVGITERLRPWWPPPWCANYAGRT